MKKSLLIVLLAVMACSLFVSCVSTSPVNATSNALGSKMGESTQTFLFGFIPLNGGEGAIYQAAKNAGITEISTVDQVTTDYYFFKTVTTVVTGE